MVGVIPPAARAFLERQRVARLATTSGAGQPHVVPICFALLADTLYLAIDDKPKTADWRSLRRLRNIAANPRVAVVAVDVARVTSWGALE